MQRPRALPSITSFSSADLYSGGLGRDHLPLGPVLEVGVTMIDGLCLVPFTCF